MIILWIKWHFYSIRGGHVKNDLKIIFNLAANYYYKEYRKAGGTQERLAEDLGVSQPYISSVMSGSKLASLELQGQIANILSGKQYEEFLTIGRRIKNGLEPQLLDVEESHDTAEKLIARLSHYVVDHQRIEQELIDKQWLLQEALDTASYGIIIFSKNEEVLAYNNAYLELSGYSNKTLLSKDSRAYIVEGRALAADPEEYDKQIGEIRSAKKKLTHHFKRKDGSTYKRVVFPLFKNGEIAGMVLHLYRS
jgi:PAS domain S-box-containing protein